MTTLRLARPVLLTLLLLVTLTGCGWFVVPDAVPSLVVERTSVVLEGGVDALVLVRNDGEKGSTLRFTVTSSAGWLAVPSGERSVAAGRSVSVRLGVRAGVPVARGAAAVVTISSDGGDATVQVVAGASVGSSVCAPGNPASAWVGAAEAVGASAWGASTLGDDAAAGVFGGAESRAESRAESDVAAALATRGEVLVFYRAGVERSARTDRLGAAAAAAGARLLRAGVDGQPDLVRLPSVGAEAALRALERDPRVAVVAPNVEVRRLADASAATLGSLDAWTAACFGLPQAWAVERGQALPGADDVVIAVVDDGVLVQHPALQGKVLPGYDLADRDADVVHPTSSHGTHVAGIALALDGVVSDVSGVAFGPRVLLLPVKVFPDGPGNADLATVIDGMRWAVGLPVAGAPPNPYPADVVNLSLGAGSLVSIGVAQAFAVTVDEMRARGAVVVAAAGNRGFSTGVEYPARVEGALAVGAVDWTGNRSLFSTHGVGLDLVAPGGAAPSGASCASVLGLGVELGTQPGLACLGGTSMATAYVSGVAALLIANDPERFRADPAALEARVLATTLFAPGMRVEEFGAGIVCADAALGTGTRCGWTLD